MPLRQDDVQRPAWRDSLPPEVWRVYHQALTVLRARRLRFAVGGGFAFSLHSGRWRNTKDLDLYILEEDVDQFVAALTEAGLEDFFPLGWYDRKWIYRAHRNSVIVDLIWAMANHRAQVDERWLMRGPRFEVGGMVLRALGAEELIWVKLFVFQRDRCDWPDLLNVLSVQVERIDWDRLLALTHHDALLLGGLLSVFRWLCPERSSLVPGYVWPRVGLQAQPPVSATRADLPRAKLLSVHDWFGPVHTGRAARRQGC